MKLINYKILTQRKTIFIFLLAILLPSLIVGYLSLSTFSKRREAVKKLLESNLWISGEAALKSVEGSLLEYEQKVLKPENFIHLIRSEKTDQSGLISPLMIKDSVGQLFLLDAGFNIVFPETAGENKSDIQWEKEIQNSQVAELFQRAEYFEFARKNYKQAAEIYKIVASSSSPKHYQAVAFESLGRCLFADGKLEEAAGVYHELSKNYGQFLSKAGHPYGIVALFQLYEIAGEKKEEQKSLGILLDLYGKLRNGTWLINQSVYDFYIEEIETILNSKFIEGKFPEIQKTYTAALKQQSPYKQDLLFTDFLVRNTIPVLKEKIALSRAAGEFVPGRFLIAPEKEYFMVSYAILPGFQSGQTYYGGFCWDINLLKNQIMLNILESMTKESGLDFKIVDEKNQNILTGKEEILTKEPLPLTFRFFPLPWKLLVSHPEIKAIEKAARREIFFYGILLSVIVALMLLGAFLIVRDISRQSETSRLKTEFVNNISHELKTPLTLIRLYGETLQRKKNLTNGEKKESYEIITKESERLSHLINNVLDFSRIETGRKEFDLKKGYMQEVIADTLESYRYHLEKKGFAIHSDIADDLPEMNFDGEAIASVLINLLGNAMKFSPKEKEVTVKLFRDEGSVVLQVADKGIGIPPEEIPKIFERFYRVENKTARETRGSGLGLTLVKHITEAHNGSIQVESEPGKGSLFTIRIPLHETII